MVMIHAWFIGLRGHIGEFAGENNVSHLFLLPGFFSVSRHSRARFWGLILWHLWIGRAKHPGPAPLPRHVGVEVLDVGGFLMVI